MNKRKIKSMVLYMWYFLVLILSLGALYGFIILLINIKYGIETFLACILLMMFMTIGYNMGELRR